MKILKSIKRDTILIGTSLIVGLFLGAIFFGGSSEKGSDHDHENIVQNQETMYTCAMHPQIKQNKPGLCPICAMDLVPLTTVVSGDEVDPNEIQMTESAMKLAEIQTAVVKQGTPQKSIHLFGKVEADERNVALLTMRFGGRIEKLFVNYTGQNVKKDQKLATIYSPDLLTTQKELLEAIKYKESNPSFYQASRNKLKLWDLNENQIDAIENRGESKLYHDILSPTSGTVTKRQVSIGDYVKEGSSLFEVIDLTQVWVMFDAYESDLPWIKTGDNVQFTIQSLPGKDYKGKVSYVDPIINEKSRVAKVRIEIANPKLTLKPGMFVNGVLESKIAENSKELLIPKSAILWTGKRAIVYVKIPNRETPTFIHREIRLGPEAGDHYVAAEGLSEGEIIAANGVFKIDASAQLAGKVSMMSPSESGEISSSQSAKMKSIELREFKVFGNCVMCKDRIEKTAKAIKGVLKAEWNQETKMFAVSFNKSKTSLDEMHKEIARVGHDTELYKADDEVYSKLPQCCLYRPTK